MRRHGIAGFSFGTVALNEVGNDQFGGDVAFRKVNFRLLAVNLRCPNDMLAPFVWLGG